MTVRRVHLVIKGLVQGVSYRASAQDEARRLGVKGWVRNLPNGDVESIAEANPETIERFVTWCRTGPEEARVTHVAVTEATGADAFSDFQVRR
jgi:acylphosphatase